VAAYDERTLSSEQASLANIADWVRPKNGATWPLRRDELWLAGTPGGDRPVLVLTRDPVADRIGALVVADLTRTRRGLSSELELTVDQDHVPSNCVVNFDNIHTLPRNAFRQRITRLSPTRLHGACRTLRASTGC
jgi:mRNA interferase MazF